jgi:hypothetical protein
LCRLSPFTTITITITIKFILRHGLQKNKQVLHLKEKGCSGVGRDVVVERGGN